MSQPFGRYTLTGFLAAGGMADVYRAEVTGEAGFQKELAIKIIRGDFGARDEFVEMFKQEARIASRLNHSHLVHVFDFGQVDGRWFIAMELVRGKTLAEIAARARAVGVRLELPLVLQIASQVAAALAYVHRLEDKGRPLGLVHRDVSPQNVLVSLEGEVKLADFGIARAVKTGAALTIPGTIKGKPAYMAPEQARGRDVDARADVFALGIVLWELCCGFNPFERETFAATLLALTGAEPVDPPSRWNAQVPPALDAAILGALQREPGERTRSAQELGRQLGEVLFALARKPSDVDLRALMQTLWPTGTASVPAGGTAIQDTPTPGGQPAPEQPKPGAPSEERPPRKVTRRRRRTGRPVMAATAAAFLGAVVAVAALFGVTRSGLLEPAAPPAPEPGLPGPVAGATKGAADAARSAAGPVHDQPSVDASPAIASPGVEEAARAAPRSDGPAREERPPAKQPGPRKGGDRPKEPPPRAAAAPPTLADGAASPALAGPVPAAEPPPPRVAADAEPDQGIFEVHLRGPARGVRLIAWSEEPARKYVTPWDQAIPPVDSTGFGPYWKLPLGSFHGGVVHFGFVQWSRVNPGDPAATVIAMMGLSTCSPASWPAASSRRVWVDAQCGLHASEAAASKASPSVEGAPLVPEKVAAVSRTGPALPAGGGAAPPDNVGKLTIHLQGRRNARLVAWSDEPRLDGKGVVPRFLASREALPSGQDAFGLYWKVPAKEFRGGVAHFSFLDTGKVAHAEVPRIGAGVLCSDLSWSLRDSIEIWIDAKDCRPRASPDERGASPATADTTPPAAPPPRAGDEPEKRTSEVHLLGRWQEEGGLEALVFQEKGRIRIDGQGTVIQGTYRLTDDRHVRIEPRRMWRGDIESVDALPAPTLLTIQSVSGTELTLATAEGGSKVYRKK